MAVSRLALAFSLAAAAAASAQALTLGELVDRGAQKLTPAEASRRCR